MTDDMHTPRPASDPRMRSAPPAEQRSRGRRLALTIAIVVTALLLIGAALLVIWAGAAQASATAATAANATAGAVDTEAGASEATPTEPARSAPADSSDSAADLPWDVEVEGDELVALLSLMPDAEGWQSTGANEYTHEQTGCVVWHTNGRTAAPVAGTTGR